MSGESDVTFVGGHAESQQTEGETSLPGDDREAAMAAVREALKAEGEAAVEDVKKSKDQFSAKEKLAEKDEKEPKEEEDAATAEEAKQLKRILKNREKLVKEKAKQNEEINRQRQELQQQQAQLRAYEQQLRQQDAYYKALKNDPVKAVREVGWDPEEFITSLAKEGTEEGKMARLMREQQAQLQDMHNWRQQQMQLQQQYMQQMQQQQLAQARDNVEKEFKGYLMDAEKAPFTSAVFKGNTDFLVHWGDSIAAQYREATGQEASIAEIAEYIEEQLASASENWYTSRVGSKKDAASSKNGNPPKGAAKGKTLTSSASSERRSLGKEIQDLDGDERLAAAKEAVAAALAASKSG